MKEKLNSGLDHSTEVFDHSPRGIPLKNIQAVDTAVLPVKKRRNSQPFKSSNVKGISIKTKKTHRKTAYCKTKETEFSIKFSSVIYKSSQPMQKKPITEKIKDFICIFLNFFTFLKKAVKFLLRLREL